MATDQTWQRTGSAARSDALALGLGLTGVRSLRVDGVRAGLSCASRVPLTVPSDGPLTGLRPGAEVVTGETTRQADRTGTLRPAVAG